MIKIVDEDNNADLLGKIPSGTTTEAYVKNGRSEFYLKNADNVVAIRKNGDVFEIGCNRWQTKNLISAFDKELEEKFQTISLSNNATEFLFDVFSQHIVAYLNGDRAGFRFLFSPYFSDFVIPQGSSLPTFLIRTPDDPEGKHFSYYTASSLWYEHFRLLVVENIIYRLIPQKLSAVSPESLELIYYSHIDLFPGSTNKDFSDYNSLMRRVARMRGDNRTFIEGGLDVGKLINIATSNMKKVKPKTEPDKVETSNATAITKVEKIREQLTIVPLTYLSGRDYSGMKNAFVNIEPGSKFFADILNISIKEGVLKVRTNRQIDEEDFLETYGLDEAYVDFIQVLTALKG